MRIGFRADASVRIGTGHVMRCLALADKLREHGGECTFFCRPLRGDLISLIAKLGHEVVPLPDASEKTVLFSQDSKHEELLGTVWEVDAEDTLLALNGEVLDWLIVDHYALDYKWERALSTGCHRLLAIDDLADRLHFCDVLLDQNLGRIAMDYRTLVPQSTVLLIGPEFALLRPDFVRMRSNGLAMRERNGLKKILITIGGVDEDNFSEVVLEGLKSCALKKETQIVVVLGSTAPWIESVRSACTRMPWHTDLLVGISNMAELMSDADLCIGSAGSTSWERCVLGLPSILICTAENQRSVIDALQRNGAAIVADAQKLLESGGIHMKDLIERAELELVNMSRVAASVTDGNGCSHVARIIFSMK